MPLFEWNGSYSVNVIEFDDQHKKLIDLINKLYDAMKDGKGKEVLERVFVELIDYTVYHFSAEEKLMSRYNYPEFSRHLAAHNDLTKKAVELQEAYKKGSMFISVDTMKFLKDWLTNHILIMDKAYGAFFNDKGIK